MTSSSRRKPRTTRRSTRSPSDRRAAAALAAWLLLALPAAAADWRLFLKALPEPRPVADVIAEPEPEAVAPPVAAEEPQDQGPDAPADTVASSEPTDQAAVAAGAAADADPDTDAAEGVGPVAPAEPAALAAVAAVPAAPCDSCPATAALVAAAEPEAQGPCAEDAVECREALEKLRADILPNIDLDIRVGGRAGSDYPCECRLEGETFQPRRFAATMFTWKAAGYCHKPLYFEDWNLERYGHSHGPLDPVFSAAHFFVTLPVLPYKMGVELPWECVYPLGYYRPGNCAPWTVPAVPISGRGLAVQAATVTGLVFLLP